MRRFRRLGQRVGILAETMNVVLDKHPLKPVDPGGPARMIRK